MRCLDVRASVERIAAFAGIDPDFTGDTTPGLAEAAKAYGCQMQHVCRNSSVLARIALANLGAPVLVCLDRWNHWVCVVGANSRHVHYLDSERPGPVDRQDTWLEFLSRAGVWHGENRWDFYPVVRS